MQLYWQFNDIIAAAMALMSALSSITELTKTWKLCERNNPIAIFDLYTATATMLVECQVDFHMQCKDGGYPLRFAIMVGDRNTILLPAQTSSQQDSATLCGLEK